MRIGILGSGLMGSKLGTIFARAGHDVIFSYARSEQKLKRLAREAKGKARAGTPREAAQDADAVLLAVHWLRFDDVLKQAGDLSGKVVVTCSMPMNEDNTELVVAHTSSGAEELAKRIPKARLVAAFGTVPSEVFFDVYEARRKARRPSLLYCGDDRRGEEGAVVLTLIAERPPSRAADAGAAFATPTIVHFGTALLLSAILRAPWQAVTPVAALWALVGLSGAVYTGLVARRMRGQTAYRPELEDWLFHCVLPLAAYAILALSAFAALSHTREALFGVGTAALLLLLLGIHNARDGIA